MLSANDAPRAISFGVRIVASPQAKISDPQNPEILYAKLQHTVNAKNQRLVPIFSDI
jgi:hypothetical protein